MVSWLYVFIKDFLLLIFLFLLDNQAIDKRKNRKIVRSNAADLQLPVFIMYNSQII